MKKIFTLIAGLFLMVAAMAADRRPVVTVNNSKNYKIVIDGKSYFGTNTTISLSNLMTGKHTIKVYEMKKSGYGRMAKEVMTDAATFNLSRNDVSISIDRFGNVAVSEVRERGRFERIDNNRGRQDHDWNKKDDRKRF